MTLFKKINLRIKQMTIIVILYACKIMSLFTKKEHWVVSERGYDARDNGYFFYKYLASKHPELKVYYLINKKSADYSKVKDNAVAYGSLKSFWLLASCKKIISTHYALICPNMSPKLFKVSGLYKKFYFLQHGIIQNSLAFLYAQSAPMRLFVCGAKPEYDFVKENFGHPEGVVQYTGLARYDNLDNANVKKQILVMPTWRQYIRTEEEFLTSEYYESYSRLISNEKLIKKLEEKNIDLVFYPHYEVQKWIKHFSSKSKNVIIASFEEYDVQALLKQSALLITDYSSVFFDFAYMGKPVVYFQFDKEDFFDKHYQKGYFDYLTMGFGPVFKENDEVAEYAIDMIEEGLNQKQEYQKRIEGFFALRDKNNCERIYQAIIQN